MDFTVVPVREAGAAGTNTELSHRVFSPYVQNRAALTLAGWQPKIEIPRKLTLDVLSIPDLRNPWRDRCCFYVGCCAFRLPMLNKLRTSGRRAM